MRLFTSVFGVATGDIRVCNETSVKVIYVPNQQPAASSLWMCLGDWAGIVFISVAV